MLNLTKIIAAILVLLAVLLGGYAWMLSRKPPPPPPVAAAPKAGATQENGQTFAIVVAAKALPAGQAITSESVRVMQLPINPAGAFRDASAVAGRVPALDLGEGTPLTEGQLVSGLALRVGEGERAVAVKADEVMGVGNKIRPGDFVDVFFVLKADSKEIDRSQARLLLARKRVLAFGSASVDAQPSKAGDGAAPQQRADIARTAVLAIPIEEVNRLAVGETAGRLLLALRNPADTTLPDPSLFADLPPALQPQSPKAGQPKRTEPLRGLDKAQAGLATVDLVAGGDKKARPIAASTQAPRAAVPRRSGNEVEVIRGDRRETLQY